MYCESLESVELPEGLQTLGGGAFHRCGSLKSLSLPSTLAEIPCGAFFCDFSLASISFSDGLATIGKRAFYNCRSLANVVFPRSLRRVESEAFWACPKLSSVFIPASLETMAYDAFYRCPISQIEVSQENPFFRSVDGVLFNADGRTLVFYPRTRTDKKYVVPDGVVEIGPARLIPSRVSKRSRFRTAS